MSPISQGIQSVLSMMIMIGIGYVLTGIHWFDEKFPDTLVKIVTVIALPLMMLGTVTSNFDKDTLLNLAKGVFIPFLSILICYLISVVLSNILKIDPKSKGLYRSLFFNSNSIFMGLPINIAISGDACIPFVLLYYIANTTCFWTIGINEISKDGARTLGKEVQSIFSKNGLRKIMSPPLIGFLVGIVLVLFNIKLPMFLQDSAKNLGNLTTPLSMIFIGCILYTININDIKLDKYNISILIGRFIISPLTILIITTIIPVPKMMRDVLVIQAAMPTMTSSAIIAKGYASDEKKAVVSIWLTTIVFLFALPVYMWILN